MSIFASFACRRRGSLAVANAPAPAKAQAEALAPAAKIEDARDERVLVHLDVHVSNDHGDDEIT